jgi:hypothetical protein
MTQVDVRALVYRVVAGDPRALEQALTLESPDLARFMAELERLAGVPAALRPS